MSIESGTSAVYSSSSGALESLQKGVGTSIDLSSGRADKSLGTSMRRLLGNTQSRVKLMDALDELQGVVKETGGSIDDNIMMQAKFADELERMFGSSAPTSFGGQIERHAGRAIDSVTSKQGATRAAIDAAAKLAGKAVGINEEAAIAAAERLLKSKALRRR